MLASIRRLAPRLRLPLQRPTRCRHTGPHKEYFQNPSQYPTAAGGHKYAPPPPNFQAPPSVLKRLFRSAILASVCGGLGVIAGTGAITWEYLQPPFELGSEEELDMGDDINNLIFSHPLFILLNQHPEWTEQHMYMPEREWDKEENFHFLSRKTLKGSNGVSMIFFSNPSPYMPTCLLFYPGPGVEGWPDTMHGGMITTLIHEAMEQTATVIPLVDGATGDAVVQALQVDFRKPMQPGTVYAIFIFTGLAANNPDSLLPVDNTSSTVKLSALVGETDTLDFAEPLLTRPTFKQKEITIHAVASGRLSYAAPKHLPEDPVSVNSE